MGWRNKRFGIILRLGGWDVTASHPARQRGDRAKTFADGRAGMGQTGEPLPEPRDRRSP